MKKLLKSDNTFLFATEKGVYKLQIKNDVCCDNPRKWDTIATLIAFGRSQWISDEKQNIWNDGEEFMNSHPSKDWIILPLYKYEHGGVAYKTTPFSCHWDSGMFIYCSKESAISEFGKKYCTAKVRQKAVECMDSEIKTFSNWANGQCYGYILEVADWNGVFDTTDTIPNYETCLEIIENWGLNDEWDNVEFKEMDSCWGFIEDIVNYEQFYCYEEAVAMIE